MKRTPLYDEHVKLGGKIVEFAGWEMPVQYSGVIAEHIAVRERLGLFDVSHMGEIWVTGAEAEKALQYLTCNNLSNLYDGKAQYSALLNDEGGVIDDIIVYRFSSERFLLCVNASNASKDYEWITKKNPTSATVVNASDEYGQIAVQGPLSSKLLGSLVGNEKISALKYFHFLESEIGGAPVIVARTGYTGEDGFEIFVSAQQVASLWNLFVEKSAPLGGLPCGLGARDSLRLEAAYPLHGHELAVDVPALESGLGWIIKFDKGDFLGKAALERYKAAGQKRKLVGFHLVEPGIARQGDLIASGEEGVTCGVVTSGTKTPTLNVALGMAFVESGSAAVGQGISCVVRGRKIAAKIVALPFYKRVK